MDIYDNKKVIIAIAVAAIVVVAAIGIGVFVMNNNNNGTAKDELRDGDIAVGDYNKFDVDMKLSSAGANIRTMTENDYLKIIFVQSGGSPTSDTIKIDGKTYDCWKRVSQQEGLVYTFWGVKNTDWMVKYEEKTNDGIVITSVEFKNQQGFNFNADKNAQQFAEGKYVEYYYKMQLNPYGLASGTMEFLITNYQSAQSMTVSQDIAIAIDNDSLMLKISSIYGDQIVYDNGTRDTKQGFMSDISFESFKKDYIGDEKMKNVTKENKTIDTPFGKRDVTIEQFDVTKPDGTIHYTVTHSGDVIYSYEVVGFSPSLSLDIKEKIVLIETTMFK